MLSNILNVVIFYSMVGCEAQGMKIETEEEDDGWLTTTMVTIIAEGGKLRKQVSIKSTHLNIVSVVVFISRVSFCTSIQLISRTEDFLSFCPFFLSFREKFSSLITFSVSTTPLTHTLCFTLHISTHTHASFSRVENKA